METIQLYIPEIDEEIGLIIGTTYQGPQGPTGPQGPQGPQGPTGANGQDGTVSFDELTPEQIAQLTGPTGPQGANGADGAQGPQGPTGPQGENGNDGAQGPTGPTGPKGEDGTVSFDELTPEQIAQLTGPTGPQGANGADGAQGPTGAEGPTGPQGEQGPQGPTGPQGEQGPQGPTGADGAVGQTGPTGPQGEQGPQGPTGADGAVGPTGPTGPKGEDGGGGVEIVTSLPLTGTDGQMVILSESGASGTTKTLYTYSEEPMLCADIRYGNVCIRVDYDELPSNETLFVVRQYTWGSDYFHFVYENGELHSYKSDNNSTYTGSNYTNVNKYQDTPLEWGPVRVYYTDTTIIVYQAEDSSIGEININFSAFYTIGWHKNINHIIDSHAIYESFSFWDGDRNLIIKNRNYQVNKTNLHLNKSIYDIAYTLYTRDSGGEISIFAPTTTGTTGYVCVAGNGYEAPTWAEPSTLTNGVKFWKGSQAEYDALSGGTGYDNSTLYIITSIN